MIFLICLPKQSDQACQVKVRGRDVGDIFSGDTSQHLVHNCTIFLCSQDWDQRRHFLRRHFTHSPACCTRNRQCTRPPAKNVRKLSFSQIFPTPTLFVSARKDLRWSDLESIDERHCTSLYQAIQAQGFSVTRRWLKLSHSSLFHSWRFADKNHLFSVLYNFTLKVCNLLSWIRDGDDADHTEEPNTQVAVAPPLTFEGESRGFGEHWTGPQAFGASSIECQMRRG